jgi:uncharacterized protein (DUF885 family)
MKAIIGGAFIALLLATPAFAQNTSPAPSASCQGIAAPPTLIDGATARAAAVASTNTAFQEWLAQVDTRLTACRTEAEAARAQAESLSAAYNSAAEQRNAAVEAWRVEVEEYNARAGGGTVRGGGSGN